MDKFENGFSMFRNSDRESVRSDHWAGVSDSEQCHLQDPETVQSGAEERPRSSPVLLWPLCSRPHHPHLHP